MTARASAWALARSGGRGGLGEGLPPASAALGVLSALVNIYAAHLLQQTIFVGTIPGTTLQYVEDTASGILTLQQSVATGALQAGDYVQLAIGADGSLTTTDGELVGQVGADHGFTVSPVFQAEFNAGATGYIDDPNTVYSSRALRQALGPPPPGMPDPNAHHIVPEGGGGQSGLRDPGPAQRIMAQFNVSLDSAEDGVYVTAPYNKALNSSQYVTNLNLRLSKATSQQDVLDILNDIKSQIQNGQAEFTATGTVPTFK